MFCNYTSNLFGTCRMSEGVEVNVGSAESVGSVGSKEADISSAVIDQQAPVTDVSDDNAAEAGQPHADDNAGLQRFSVSVKF